MFLRLEKICGLLTVSSEGTPVVLWLSRQYAEQMTFSMR